MLTRPSSLRTLGETRTGRAGQLFIGAVTHPDCFVSSPFRANVYCSVLEKVAIACV